MRGLALVVVLLAGFAGCLLHRSGSSDDPGQDGPGGEPRVCRAPLDCSADELCARTHVCWPSDQLRAIHASWTLKGAPASATTFASAPGDLMITFSQSSSGHNDLTFVPVACAEGKFTIDLVPLGYDRVALGRPSGDGRQEAAVDAAGNAVLDLPY
jgi:hypothetical protein